MPRATRAILDALGAAVRGLRECAGDSLAREAAHARLAEDARAAVARARCAEATVALYEAYFGADACARARADARRRPDPRRPRLRVVGGTGAA